MRRPPLTGDQILAWADHHRKATGKWPAVTSGRILGVRGENWRSVHDALRSGYRGMQGGSSLALFLAEHRDARNRTNLPALTTQQILSWADLHHDRTGEWPTLESGAVVDAPEETWGGIDQALKNASRGLPGGDSLGRLLVEHRGVRNHTNILPLSIPQILAWADAHHERTGEWPNLVSGPIPELPGDTWATVGAAIQHGLRGLAGGKLYRLLKEQRQIPGKRPRLCPLKVKKPGRGRPGFRIYFPEEILARYRAGELDSQGVADLCGVSLTVALRELHRVGAPVPGQGRPLGQRPDLHTEVIQRYRRGESLACVAAALGLTAGRVATILRRYQVALRPRGHNLFRPDMSHPDRQRLATRLKELRAAAGFTQDDLVSWSGLTQNTISALENAQTPPTHKTMKALARALKVKPEDLLGSP